MLRRSIQTRWKQLQGQRQPGQSVILVALALVVLIGFVGVAIDGSNAFTERRAAMNAVDIAAMNGVRAMLAARNQNQNGAYVRTIIENTLQAQGLETSNLTWQAYYVSRAALDNPNAPIIPAGFSGRDTADGVRIEISYRFPTYFIGLFGWNELPASASATAIHGPIGVAVGSDLIPIAVGQEALDILITSVAEADDDDDEAQEFELDLRGRIQQEYEARIPPESPPDSVIRRGQIIHISFGQTDQPPTTASLGSFQADCASNRELESLVYWWCNGTQFNLRINRVLPIQSTPNFNVLNDAIRYRISRKKQGFEWNNRSIALLPVWTIRPLRDEDGNLLGERYFVDSFVPVELLSYDRNRGVLRLRPVNWYATAGALIGEGNGVRTGAYAINLVR
jgi:hypothetical protein